MSGDGVSLQPTIVQMGTVAQAQAKGQQAQHPTSPFSERLEQNQDTKVQRVRKADEARRGRVDREEKRREQGRGAAGEHGAAGQERGSPPPDDSTAGPDDDPGVGRLLDTRA